MMRLIDADELKRDICNYLASFMNGEIIGDIVKIIDNAPTVERLQPDYCEGCMYENMSPDKYPCCDCKNNHKNYWRPKK